MCSIILAHGSLIAPLVLFLYIAHFYRMLCYLSFFGGHNWLEEQCYCFFFSLIYSLPDDDLVVFQNLFQELKWLFSSVICHLKALFIFQVAHEQCRYNRIFNGRAIKHADLIRPLDTCCSPSEKV